MQQAQARNVARAREMVQLAGAMRIEELLELLAESALLELPFAPGGMPKTLAGKTAIREFLLDTRGRFSRFSMSIDAIHATADPNVVLAEHRSDGVVAGNERPYRNRYVTLFQFDSEGRIVNWREYFDAGVVVRAFAAPAQSSV